MRDRDAVIGFTLVVIAGILFFGVLFRTADKNIVETEKAKQLCSPFAYITHNDKYVVCESIDSTRAQLKPWPVEKE